MRFWMLLFALPLAAQDYTLSLRVNPAHVYAGYTAASQVQVTFADAVGHVYFDSMTSGNAEVAAAPWCNVFNPDCWGTSPKYFFNTSNSTIRFQVRTTASAEATPGNYTVTVTVTANSIQKQIAVPITVAAAPTPVTPYTVPKRTPKPAGWSTFSTKMLSEAERHCDPDDPYAVTFAFGTETQVWYYDGALVYWKVADATGDGRWRDCALNIASQYSAYVTANSGAIPGWRVFTEGLRRAFEWTRNPAYANSIQLLANASNGAIEDSSIRETAYALRAYTDSHRLGQTVTAPVDRTLMYLIGHFETLFCGPPEDCYPLIHQTFYDGLGAQALTYYYDYYEADPRIPPTIKKMLDWLWEHAWDGVEGELVWNPYPTNASEPRFCESGCETGNRDLMNLTIWAYWWYWHTTGDTEARDRGDAMFAYALADDITYSGKVFSQNFRDSITAMEWRYRTITETTGGMSGVTQ